MNDDTQTTSGANQAQRTQGARPGNTSAPQATIGLQDHRTRLRQAFEDLEARVRTFFETLGRVSAQAPPGADKAEHAHAVQLADEAIKGIAGVGETFTRASDRLSPFAQN